MTDCDGDDNCIYEPPSSGTMELTAIVNGVEHTESQYIVVDSCPPTGDALLDDPKVRKALRDALAASDPTNPVDTQRREKGLLFWRHPDGSIEVEPATPVNSSNCHFKFPGASETPDRILVGRGHTHPYEPPMTAGETGEKAQCPGESRRHPYGPFRLGGGSASDWSSVDAVSASAGRPVPTYTIDNRFIHRLDPNVAPADRWKNPNRWRHKPGECLVPFADLAS